MTGLECDGIGNLTTDPQPRKNGEICALRAAFNVRRKNANGDPIEETTFMDISVFGKQAVPCLQYLHKGSKIFVKGTLKQSTYTDNQGNEKTGYSIAARKIEFLDPRDQNQHPNQGYGGGGYNQQPQHQGQGYNQQQRHQQPAAPQYHESGGVYGNQQAAQFHNQQHQRQRPAGGLPPANTLPIEDELPF